MIEIKIIKHRNTEDFFRGFFGENDSIQYGYQLRRMFESSASFEDDYIVLEVDEKPFMSIEIFRTSTRRILSLMPKLSPLFTDEEQKEFFLSAFDKFMNYETKMYKMIRFENPLEVVLNSNYKFYEEMKSVVEKYEFKKIFQKYEFDIEISEIPEFSLDNKYKSEKFTDYDVEKRYELIENGDVYMKEMEIDVRELYVDYIEENVESEILWEVVKKDVRDICYILPMFDIARQRLEIFDYAFFDEKNKDNFKILLSRIKDIGLSKKVKKVKLNIYKKDEAIFDILQKDVKKDIKDSYYYGY